MYRCHTCELSCGGPLWLQVASVPELEPFVLFMDGKPGEKRYLANADDIIRQLQQTFPGVCAPSVLLLPLPP